MRVLLHVFGGSLVLEVRGQVPSGVTEKDLGLIIGSLT